MGSPVTLAIKNTLNIKELLPSLIAYKENFIKEGINYPLSKVPYQKYGLLKDLPTSKKTGWPWSVETAPDLYDSKISWPKITIVTPSYQQGQYIEETIRAVLLQNYPNLEYIVIDGGSTDETKKILERYSPWISHWQIKKDNGQGNAINLGFSLASGEIYGWINSDDFYMKSAFLELIKSFRNSKVEMVYGDGIVINEATQSIHYQKAYFVKPKYLFVGGIIMQHSCFWRASIHQPILEQLYCAVDSELWFRMVPNKKLKHVYFPLGVARIQPEAKTHNDKFAEKWKEDNCLINELHQFENRIPNMKYIQSRMYLYEVQYFQRIYKAFNLVNIANHLAKLKSS